MIDEENERDDEGQGAVEIIGVDPAKIERPCVFHPDVEATHEVEIAIRTLDSTERNPIAGLRTCAPCSEKISAAGDRATLDAIKAFAWKAVTG